MKGCLHRKGKYGQGFPAHNENAAGQDQNPPPAKKAGNCRIATRSRSGNTWRRCREPSRMNLAFARETDPHGSRKIFSARYKPPLAPRAYYPKINIPTFITTLMWYSYFLSIRRHLASRPFPSISKRPSSRQRFIIRELWGADS